MSVQIPKFLGRSFAFLAYRHPLIFITLFMFCFEPFAAAQAKPLSDAVRSAREKGKDTVEYTSLTDLIGAGESINSLDKVFSVLEAIPTHTYTEITDGGITTWYSFQVIEILRKGSGCIFCSANVAPPTGALPASSGNTIFVPVSGGSSVASGVHVIAHSNASVTLELGKRYLLILASIHSSDKVHFLSAGPSGAFSIDSSGALSASSQGHSQSTLVQSVLAYKNLQAIRSLFHAH